jgi:hypothetical protein
MSFLVIADDSERIDPALVAARDQARSLSFGFGAQ